MPPATKKRRARPQAATTASAPALSTTQRQLRLLYALALAAICLTAAVALLYKAHTAGLQHDESVTWFDYAQKLENARYSYKSTNNHVLNSICIHIAHVLFKSYEHFPRIPVIFTSLTFVAAIAYVVTRTIRNRLLQLATLIFVLAARGTFGYLYVARGYSYGFAALALTLALAAYLNDHPIRPRHAWLPILALSFFNFIALGAMTTTLFLVLACNAVFVLWWTARIYRPALAFFKRLALYAPAIAALTALAVLWLYWPIIRNILGTGENPYVADIAASWHGWPSFLELLDRILVYYLIGIRQLWRWLALLIAALALAGAALRIYRWRSASPDKNPPQTPDSSYTTNALFIILVLALYLIQLFVFSVILAKSPGLERNHMFLQPLFIIAAAFLLEGLLPYPSRTPNRRTQAVTAALAIFLVLTALQDPPRIRHGRYEMSRPTLQKLKSIDPHRLWTLCFAPKIMTIRTGFSFYLTRDEYRFQFAPPAQTDVFILPPELANSGAPCLMKEYFLGEHDCVLQLNPNRLNLNSPALQPHVSTWNPETDLPPRR